MKLIIDIPDNEYQYTCDRTLHDRSIWDNAIRNGIPLDDVRENIHGEWEEDKFGFHHCSKCGWDSIDVDEKEFTPNFCPNCGADMRTYNGYTVSNEYVDYQDRVGADMRGDNK